MLVEGVPGISPELWAKLESYEQVRDARLVGWLPNDGGILITTRFGNTRQFHRVAAPGAAREQLTFFSEPVGSAALAPGGRPSRFAFVMDSGGSEDYQLHLYDLRSSQSRRLSYDEARHGGLLMGPDGSRLAYSSNERNGVDFDVWVTDLSGAGTEMVLEGEGYWQAVDWSPDGKRLLVMHYISVKESEVWVLDLGTGALQPLQELEGPVAYGTARFDGQGRGVYFISDQWRGVRELAHIELSPGAEPKTLFDSLRWDVEDLECSADGQHLAFTVNEKGSSQLYLLDPGGDSRPQHLETPMGLIGGLAFDASGERLAFDLETPTAPADVYVLERKRPEQRTRWTFSELGGLAGKPLVSPRHVYYRSFDRGEDGVTREIPALYYAPEGPGPHPVVVYIHGGPEGQTRPGFSTRFQFWVQELGLAVLAPNVRGSTGYGREYTLLDDGMRREDSVDDIGALLDWIGLQDELDATRVGVYGGSYGGYMVLASLVHFPERIAAGVDIVGISNFVTFLENTRAYRQDLRRAEYGDERDPEMREFLEKASPLNHVAAIQSPLMVVQGANDPRVPPSEAEQIVEAMRAKGTDVFYILAQDEGHGFRKKENRDWLDAAVAQFWMTRLGAR
jgi:dipeptidyl aminopeptidase/acylaminoacyl peptidase